MESVIPFSPNGEQADGRQHQDISGWLAWLTVERAAYALLTVLGLAARWVRLNAHFLAPNEANQAWHAWQASQGGSFDMAGLSPLLFGFQRFTFAALGGSEFQARFWPTLAGALAVWCIWALRSRLGRGGALSAAFLWTFSPLAVLGSRVALGDAWLPPLALLIVVCADRLNAIDAKRWLAFGAIALGLLLLSAPFAWAVVVVLGIVFGAALYHRPTAWLAALWRAGWRRALLAFALTLVLGATTFWIDPGGLAAAADLFGAWARGLGLGFGAYGAGDLARTLVLGEPLLLGLAAAGAVMAFRRRDLFGRLSVLATALVTLLIAASHAALPSDLGILIVPLVFLAGPALAEVFRMTWERRADVDPWLLWSLSAVLLVAAAISLPSYLGTSSPENRRLYSAVGIGTFGLTILLWVTYGVWGDWVTVRRSLPGILVALGMVWGVAQLNITNYDSDWQRRSGVLAETSTAGWQDLRNELTGVAAMLGVGRDETPLQLRFDDGSDPRLYVLRWQLRAYPQQIPDSSAPVPLIITAADQAMAPGANYGGSQSTLVERWTPAGLDTVKERVRWILFRETATPAEKLDVVLWVDRTAKPGGTTYFGNLGQ
jgi:hypothetical protein